MAEILVFRHAEDEDLGALAPLLAARGIGARYVDLHRGQPVPPLGGAAGLIVLGGPMGVGEQAAYPHLADERAAIEQALARGIPVLGICLGSQLLAWALGARVEPNPRGPEIGWLPVRALAAAGDDALLGHFGAQEVVLHWHRDVFELPAGAVALASSHRSPVQAYRYGACAWGLLFHIEVDKAELDRWLRDPAMRDDAARAGPDTLAALERGAAAGLAGLERLRAGALAALCDRLV